MRRSWCRSLPCLRVVAYGCLCRIARRACGGEEQNGAYSNGPAHTDHMDIVSRSHMRYHLRYHVSQVNTAAFL